MKQSEIGELHKRVETLERRGRVWMWVSMFLFVLILGFVATEKFVPLIVPRQVAAQKFVLRDKDGSMRAKLDIADSTVNLKLSDANGLTRAMLVVTDYGTSSLRFFDHKGHTRVILGVLTNALPGLYLKDVNRRTRLGLVVLPTTEPVMFIKDDTGQTLWRAP